MIREATVEDVPVLVTLGLAFITTTAYAEFLRLNPPSLAATATALITGEQSTVFLEERDGVVTGMLGCVRYDQPMSGDKIAGETFWFVDPKVRGTGPHLLRRFLTWARQMGAEYAQASAPAGAEDVAAIYEVFGFREIERTFQVRL